MTTGPRQFDIILWGATGYTGSLVARHLVERAGGDVRWALAGRNREKLERLRAELGGRDAAILTADSHDRMSLDALADQGRVVCTTVGPYAEHGSELVAACARSGTSYCDLTGEPHWMRKMIDAHDADAKRSGARIVHACGFDSIPSDLGTWMVQDYARRELGAPLDEVKCRVTRLKGGASGGTVASMRNVMLEATRDPEVRRILMDPYALNPPGERHGPDRVDPLTPRRDPHFGWSGPFIMASVNTRVVRRTNALMNFPYGRGFRYSEAMATGRGARGCARAIGTTALVTAAALSFTLPGLRALAGRLVPKSGEGPTPEQRERGGFVMEFLGTHPTGRRVRGRVSARRDPGYGATAWMLAESALCLALDADELSVGGGSWTPAAAMGDRLIERLRAVGMEFSVKQEERE